MVDGITLKLPVLGNIMRKIAVARFCRTLSTLIASGVPILDGLDITARTAGNAIVEDAIQITRKSIERGETISAPLKQTGVFPPMVVQMISVGEATGALDTMLSKIADFYEDEVDTAVAGMLTLLEPVMIAFLGIVVGGIVIAMYLPIFGLIGQLAGGLVSATLGSRLLTHITLRLAAATVLLGAAFVVQLRAPSGWSINPFFALIGGIYAVSLVFIATLRYVHRFPWLTDVHFAIDVLMVSATVALTGGLGQPLHLALRPADRRGEHAPVPPRRAAGGGPGVDSSMACSWSRSTPSRPVTSARCSALASPPSSPAREWRSTRSVSTSSDCSRWHFSQARWPSGRAAPTCSLEQASEQLADLQFFNQYVIDNLVSGLATADEHHRFLTFNRSAVLITGHGMASVLGKSAIDLLQIPGERADDTR